MKPDEGKRCLKLRGYELLAYKFMTLEPATFKKAAGSLSTTGFLWHHLVILWNLMSRNDSIESLMLGHIKFSNDCRGKKNL